MSKGETVLERKEQKKRRKMEGGGEENFLREEWKNIYFYYEFIKISKKLLEMLI